MTVTEVYGTGPPDIRTLLLVGREDLEKAFVLEVAPEIISVPVVLGAVEELPPLQFQRSAAKQTMLHAAYRILFIDISSLRFQDRESARYIGTYQQKSELV